MRKPKELQEIDESMVGSILVGDLRGKEENFLGKEKGVDDSPPLLLVGNSQEVFNEGAPENVFDVNAHQIFLQKVSLENFRTFHELIMFFMAGVN